MSQTVKVEKPEAKDGAALRPVTARFAEATRAALTTYARDKGLSVSQAMEQLVVAALAAQATEAVGTATAPALGAQITTSVRAGLAGVAADMTARLDRLTVEAGATRMMAYALIAYAYGEGEARQAEEACLRVATRAGARGEMAALPPGMVRHDRP